MLKKRLIYLEKEHQEDLNRLRDENESKMNELRNDFKNQMQKNELERIKCVTDLEKELHKQRKRSTKLLEEKDNEINSLKLKLMTRKFHNKEAANHSDTQSLDASTCDLDSNSNSQLLYFSQQQTAYKDSELNRLRLNNKDLEYKFKKVCDEHTVDLDRLQTQIHLLKEEIERMKLNHSRSEMNSKEENLEYIKNVVFNFMTAKNEHVRANMIEAIMQILKFTRNEKQKVHTSLGIVIK